MTKYVMAIVFALAAASPALAAGGDSGVMRHANNDLNNTKSLQRGARNYVNYCAGCHSAKYVRYSSVAEDLKLSDEMLQTNLMFGVGKVGAQMRTAMADDDGLGWFGRVPPDLSLTARAKGADWIYSYLTSFYADDSKMFGVNNLILPGAAMPHVLVELQGLQAAAFKTVMVENDGAEIEEQVFDHFVSLSDGTLSAHEFDEFARDLTNFLDYIGEPVKLERQRLGIKVMAYLTLLFLLAYALKKDFWKDVH